jgi:tetratricopeptide (TPR) repeat protein
MTTRLSSFHRLIAVLALCAAGLWGNAAHAEDDYARVQRLLKQGQITQALQQANDYIAAHPNDPQMRFLKAGVLQAAGRADDAETVLTQLTHDYPELAEPWNNLAVLYAGRGQIDTARTALEAALRIDPHYATALENMGDIDIRLALRYYEQARQADAGAAPRLSAKIDAARRVANGAAPVAAPPASPPQNAASAQQPVASQPEAAASTPQPAASQPEAAASAPATAASGAAAVKP